jgi:hypothetical protein
VACFATGNAVLPVTITSFEANELGQNPRIALGMPLRQAVHERNGAPLDPAELAQPLLKSGVPCRRRRGAHKGDGRQLCALLRPRRKRPSRRRAAEKREEVAAGDIHSITRSAMASKVDGTVRPSTFAVLPQRRREA